jgi:carbon storage regulator
MLVLSRQRDETIMIGDDIEITIVDIRGDKVRLGITAPATIPVHRKEVYEAIQRENREAAKVKMEDLPNMPPGMNSGKMPGRGPGAIGPRMPITRPGQPGEVKNGSHPQGPAGRPQSQPPATPPAAPPAPPATDPGSADKP